MEIINKRFQNLSGKKIPFEQEEAVRNGYHEVYRRGISGGYELTFAKQYAVLKDQARNSRKMVFVLEEMPPKELIDSAYTPNEITLSFGGGKEFIKGTYGLVQGRVFFVPSANGKKEKREVEVDAPSYEPGKRGRPSKAKIS